MHKINSSTLQVLFTCLILIGTISPAQARNSIANAWQTQYPASTSMTSMQTATGAVCQVCHRDASGGDPWNAYGWAVRENQGLGLPGAFTAIESLDSDFEGNDNLTEINAGSQPGWASSGSLAYFKTGDIAPADPPAVNPLDPVTDAPVINGFWPGSAAANSFIFIFGNNFMLAGEQPEVRFNGIQTLLVQVVSNDLIIAILPSGDTTGPITVTTSAGVATTAPLEFGSPPGSALKINGIWPGEAAVNDIVFVFGENYDPLPAQTQVSVNGVSASLIQVVDQSLLLFFVPAGATTAPVCVTVGIETACSNTSLTISN